MDVFYDILTGTLQLKTREGIFEDEISFDKIIGIKPQLDGIVVNYYQINDSIFDGQMVPRTLELLKLILVSIDDKKKNLIKKMGDVINATLNKCNDRPRKTCVIINPVGGKALGKSAFQKIAMPILDMAFVKVAKYYETEKLANGADIASRINIQEIDSILCVGGDGLISEVVNGLLLREDGEVACKIPLGLLPTGSQNSLSVSVTGVNDLTWAMISFVTGLRQPLDVMKVIDTESGVIRYSISMVSFGILGDITSDSETKRWLGPLRYQFSAVKKWFAMRHYKVVVSIIPDSKESTDEFEVELNDPRWHVLSGNSVFMFCCFNISGANSQMPAQVVSRPDDGLMSLLIWRESSRMRILEYMWKMKNGQHYDLDYLVFTKAKAVKIEPIGSQPNTICPINIDGEVVAPTKILVVVLPQKINLLLGQF